MGIRTSGSKRRAAGLLEDAKDGRCVRDDAMIKV